MTEHPAPDLRRDLVTASRILFMKNILDGFGHVSARDPEDPETFLISRNMAPGLVSRADIMRLDFDGNDVENSGHRPFLERFIHASIYRHRSDVNAIVHSHTASVLPFSISKGSTLEPVMHMSGFLGARVPVYEVRDHGHLGCDMLVRNSEMGDELARTLGDEAVILMRGHGMTVVAPDVRLAVFRAVYTDVNARVQTAALSMGEYTALTPGEASAADETNSAQNLRTWALWETQVQNGCAD
ncbi:class II aldolase/adducin family protein [Chelativorans sp. M5D2P16]|uniref:class II aldolase/adducin family protein n=1 Tax=Chelativorans sp. M5D2P16 TaxID=3095678 RepID=UPI002ACABF47|nr:class II aldolase/adducin family protein [Chelativorans sp. M5D2P16]MDZ5696677.1 class II aldolase/adducin family protein [Chelativorans sp. M5D2P16]